MPEIPDARRVECAALSDRGCKIKLASHLNLISILPLWSQSKNVDVPNLIKKVRTLMIGIPTGFLSNLPNLLQCGCVFDTILLSAASFCA
jgi:hypothetical protein